MSAREFIENLWDRATPVGPILDAYRVEVLREATAIAAAERLVDDTGHPRDEGYNAAIDDVVSALTRAADAA